MFNVFSKLKPTVGRIGEETTKELVERIHKEFYTASENELLEAQNVLTKCAEKDIQDGEFLNSIGFVSTQQAIETKEVSIRKRENEAKANLVIRKQVNNQIYKFISYEAVARVCEKYGLILDIVNNYIGTIPKNKIADIKKFMTSGMGAFKESCFNEKMSFSKLDKLNCIYNSEQDKFEKSLTNVKGLLFKNKEKTCFVFKTRESFLVFGRDYLREVLQEQGVKNIANCYSSTMNSLLICAPPSDFKSEKLVVFKEQTPDPVVLYSVTEGFRIVTAWGAEASDPEVANETNN